MTEEEIIACLKTTGLNEEFVVEFYEEMEFFAKLVTEKALETKDEPVAWGMEKDGVILDVICPDEHEREEGEYTIPLYITPQRTWVGLTYEEETELIRLAHNHAGIRFYIQAAEAKLKEKNNG